MPTTLKLVNMSAKYLVDFLSMQGWAKSLADIYNGGELLAVVLPRFIDEGASSSSTPSTPQPEHPANVELAVPVAPLPRSLTHDGQPDWARMSPAEAAEFRQKMAEYNHRFFRWCREEVPEFTLTDAQLLTCQEAVRYHMPRTEEERVKDREKGSNRRELPINEFSYNLLGQLKLNLK
jgi:hypothetical protein